MTDQLTSQLINCSTKTLPLVTQAWHFVAFFSAYQWFNSQFCHFVDPILQKYSTIEENTLNRVLVIYKTFLFLLRFFIGYWILKTGWISILALFSF